VHARWLCLTVGFGLFASIAAPHVWGAQFQPSPEESLRALLAVAPTRADLLRLRAEMGIQTAEPGLGRDLPPSYQIGQIDQFWVGRAQAMERRQIEAELRLVTRHAYWYVQKDRALSDSALQDVSREFERRIYPGVRRLVGSEPFPGIDNDPRITILHGDVPGVAGYVSSSDTYPRSVNQYSNEREMVYLNIDSVQPGSASYLGTLAHELTHLVHGGVAVAADTWIKEGLADLVAGLVLESRAASEAAPLPETDVALTSWAAATDQDLAVAAHYRLSELFLRYSLDRFGRPFISWLSGDEGGLTAWDQVLATASVPSGFSELFGQWVVANVVGARTGPDVYPYQSRAVDPPALRGLTRGDVIADSVAQFGVDYFELDDPGDAAVRFHGEHAVASLSGVVEPSAVWVPARADGTASHLVCSALGGPGLTTRLAYRVWFDIEPDYDFAYVSVSRDGGRTWELLRTPQMTQENTTGGNLGAGYTGRSARASAAAWIEQSIDIDVSPDEPLLVRFSYITDDAVTREGIAVDGVRLVDPGRGAERSCADWTVRGWAHVGATLPQRWLVQVIEFAGDGVRVQMVPVDDEGMGSWSAAGRHVDRVVLAVSAVTPATLQRAPYEISRQR